MRTESNQVPLGDPGTERLLVLLLLCDDRPQWSRSELEADLYDVDPDAIRGSLASLETVGVVSVNGEQIQASPAARRIDALDMICI